METSLYCPTVLLSLSLSVSLIAICQPSQLTHISALAMDHSSFRKLVRINLPIYEESCILRSIMNLGIKLIMTFSQITTIIIKDSNNNSNASFARKLMGLSNLKDHGDVPIISDYVRIIGLQHNRREEGDVPKA